MTKINKNKEVNGNCITFGGTRNVAEEIKNPHAKKGVCQIILTEKNI